MQTVTDGTPLPNDKRAYYVKRLRRAISDGTLTELQHARLNAIDFKVSPTGKGRKTRAVICIETGKRFDSVTEATAFIGLPPNKTSYICRAAAKGCAAKGYHWRYADDTSAPTPCKPNSRPVLCVETDTVYESQSAAARALGFKHAQAHISHAILNHTEWNGYHWEYADGKSDGSMRGPRSTEKPVKCVETGEVYQSIASAGRAVGKTGSSIKRAIDTGRTCASVHWKFAHPTK